MLEHFWRVLFCLLRRFVFSTVGVSAKAQRFSTRRRFGLLLTISSCSPLQPPQLRPRKLHLQPPEQRHDVLGAWHAAQHHLLRPGATRLGHLGRIAQVGQPSRQRRVAVGPGQPQRLMGVGPQEGPAQPTAGGQTLADVECRPGRISRRMLDQKADSAQTDVCCSRPCSRIANEQADNQNGHRRRLLRERPVAGACSGSRSSGAWMSWRGQAWSRSRRRGWMQVLPAPAADWRSVSISTSSPFLTSRSPFDAPAWGIEGCPQPSVAPAGPFCAPGWGIDGLPRSSVARCRPSDAPGWGIRGVGRLSDGSPQPSRGCPRPSGGCLRPSRREGGLSWRWQGSS